MNVEQLAPALEVSLVALGVLFLAVNLRAGLEIWLWWRRRGGALLVWMPPKPPYLRPQPGHRRDDGHPALHHRIPDSASRRVASSARR